MVYRADFEAQKKPIEVQLTQFEAEMSIPLFGFEVFPKPLDFHVGEISRTNPKRTKKKSACLIVKCK